MNNTIGAGGAGMGEVSRSPVSERSRIRPTKDGAGKAMAMTPTMIE